MFDIHQQMQANLSHFYLQLKSGVTVNFRDVQGVSYEGKVSHVQPNEQNLLFSNIQNMDTLEQNHYKLFQMKDIMYLTIPQTGNQEIQAKNERKSKQFVKYEQDFLESNLEDKDNNFDQFEAIQKNFGIKAHFDENSYTTALQHVPEDIKKFAEKQERDLVLDKTDNKHILEERNLKQQDDDEEMAYSSVVRPEQHQHQKNKKKEKKNQQKQIQKEKEHQKQVEEKQQVKEQLQKSQEKPKQKPEEPPIQQIQPPIIQKQEIPIFYNSSKIQLIPDDDEPVKKIKDPSQNKQTKFKVQQLANQLTVFEMIVNNYVNATEAYKWKNMVPDPIKNKKEKLVPEKKFSIQSLSLDQK